jgi:hypothetical protein
LSALRLGDIRAVLAVLFFGAGDLHDRGYALKAKRLEAEKELGVHERAGVNEQDFHRPVAAPTRLRRGFSVAR